ncbi:hypothetical protein DM01DRAFT_1377427 [Hesseltinella vesiculosa]|uniref:Transposase n=1 Tax=Hesseltinella vesiculosa TaxID=101127 RepID=A0A1X2G7G6_9FUNG|nr:hypothetical protein DM01DRAFT_1377427 [Hesseltinella vesiculosa]
MPYQSHVHRRFEGINNHIQAQLSTKPEVISDEQSGHRIGDSQADCELPSITKTATSDRCVYKTTTSTMTTTITTTTIPHASQSQKLHAALACENCDTVWHRDQNAACNILAISLHKIMVGRRPWAFSIFAENEPRPQSPSIPPPSPSQWST